ncbi:Ppx/GppA phosphatase family protein [Leptothoe sp. PORK10 BA2]|uniref:Ppx/GppA phosphatase family protein n=1 Tax=Leptothoe sp. PORK10 BA2 TaxID=3110254 RepID=UPI002B1E9F09|nr:Ppx/GppA phosphatase family protein [Leptothoe sp. PORK10 BA2]MEA5465205.1 Ppx/GppA phosphatase family protein [Leptothoe sp. PORK10 BA2]
MVDSATAPPGQTLYPPRLSETSMELRRSLQGERILAAIDVGTNSVHMVVAKIQPELPAFTIIGCEKDTVRLGNFRPGTNCLSDEAMDRGVAALKRCKQIADSHQADDIVAVATSATREAANGQFFIDRVQQEVGLEINLISGLEEARRIYLGVLSGMELHGKPHVIIDIGGGSTEIILGTGERHRFLSSTKVGAVRLNAQMITSNPISKEEFLQLQAYVRGRLEPNIDELKTKLVAGEPLSLVGTSGTVESLAILTAIEKSGTLPARLNGYTMTIDELDRGIQKLRRMSFSERLKLPEISARRAEIIVPGAVILREAMRLLDLDRITICEHALREGLVVDWMLTHGLIENRMQYQQSVRERSVLKATKKYHADTAHSQRVATFALALFDQTRGVLHQWGPLEREILWAASMLHNCGHFVSHGSHHQHSYYLIRNGELLGFTSNEIELIANIARYHRKSTPKLKHEHYKELTKENRKIVSQLSAMLRVAVGLDRRRVGAIAKFQTTYEPKKRTMTLGFTPTEMQDNCELEVWSVNDKKAYFEQEFDLKLILEQTP